RPRLQRLTCLTDLQALRSTASDKILWKDLVPGFLTEQIVTACPTIPQHSNV
ncbi:hypothetical protein DYB26_007833, partial [Aphanomyces astaci]